MDVDSCKLHVLKITFFLFCFSMPRLADTNIQAVLRTNRNYKTVFLNLNNFFLTYGKISNNDFFQKPTVYPFHYRQLCLYYILRVSENENDWYSHLTPTTGLSFITKKIINKQFVLF